MLNKLIRKGMTITYRDGKKRAKAKVFHSRGLIVWIEDSKGKITRLHRRYHKVEIVEKPVRKKGGGGKPKDQLNNLLKEISKKKSS